MVTKFGYVYIFDVETGIGIYTVRVSTETIFLTAEHNATNGMVGVNRSGQVRLSSRCSQLVYELCLDHIRITR